MRRLMFFAACWLSLSLPAAPNAATLSKIDELERRFDDYDRRLTGVEKTIELLLDYVRKGQGADLNRQREAEGPLGFASAGLENSPYSATARLRVMEDGANVYERPSKNSTTIARLNAGTWLEVRGRTENANWYRVKLPGGQIGYVDERLLEPMR